MKKSKEKVIILLMFITLVSCNNQTENNLKFSEKQNTGDRSIRADTADLTNDFYDNAETYKLKTLDIEVTGEIKNPGKVDFSKLPLRSIIVKETVLDNDGDKFVGAYRYDGYSLYDILNERHLDKKNAGQFKPIIDLYVEVENEAGEKVVVSWGEIFYPNHLHEIIIATKVMRIVPSKTNELWPLPESSKLIVARDLITERNISKPVKINVKSYDKTFKVEKGKKPLFSPKIDVYKENEILETLTANPSEIPEQTMFTIFYGRGRGIHSTQPFTGINLKNYFIDKIERTKKALREGLFVVAADDGYRAVFTYSEMCNRNDQADVLLICNPDVTDNGIFRLFPACDFFSDRAVKAVDEIYFSVNQN